MTLSKRRLQSATRPSTQAGRARAGDGGETSRSGRKSGAFLSVARGPPSLATRVRPHRGSAREPRRTCQGLGIGGGSERDGPPFETACVGLDPDSSAAGRDAKRAQVAGSSSADGDAWPALPPSSGGARAIGGRATAADGDWPTSAGPTSSGGAAAIGGGGAPVNASVRADPLRRPSQIKCRFLCDAEVSERASPECESSIGGRCIAPGPRGVGGRQSAMYQSNEVEAVGSEAAGYSSPSPI